MVKVECDRQTFTVVAGGYAKDKNHIYFDDGVVALADPETFKLRGAEIDYSMAHDRVYDKNNSYLCANTDQCGQGCYVTNLQTKKRAWYGLEATSSTECEW